MARWTGNHASLSEVGEEDIEALAATRPPVVSELQRDAMSPGRRVRTRTQPCTPEQARKRLADARKFLELAELVDDEADTATLGVSTANAVLAGIAAADAACCRAFGERSHGDDHRNAIALVAQVSPGGDDAANALRRLPAVKNDARVRIDGVLPGKRDLGLRQARKLVESAQTVLER